MWCGQFLSPGIGSKYGKMINAWNIAYDPMEDKVIIWTNHRVRIYQMRGRRLFAHPKEDRRVNIPSPGMPYQSQANDKAATSL
jgi:hypothetical protein